MIHYTGPGGAGSWVRRLRIGATVKLGQIVISDTKGAAPKGEITDPASVNDYTAGVGVVVGYAKPLNSDSITITATQGVGDSTADRQVEVEMYRPGTFYRGKLSGGVTVDTAMDTVAVNGNILVTTAASSGGTLVTDTNVGTSEFIKGHLLCLTGANREDVRVITAHSDNVSTTVTNPFDRGIVVGDQFLRVFGPFEQGFELTTDYTQFNAKPGAGVDLPDTGHACIAFMEYVYASGQTVPTVFAVFALVDAALYPVAA